MEDGPRLAPMHRLHGPAGALFATLPQWPRIKPNTDVDDRCVLRVCHGEIPPQTRVVYAVIHVAFGRVRINRLHASHLSPDGGRVTTALRCVVTRPFRQRSPCDRRLPVTQTAFNLLVQPAERASRVLTLSTLRTWRPIPKIGPVLWHNPL